ncbi:MAG: ACP phosphodiesterase [Sulfurimonadaceae bacterium]
MQGVRLHRFIDTYTDAHPIVKQSKERISPERRRFSAILIDIFYDHFLAIHWEQYSSNSLLESTQSYYRFLAAANMSLTLRLTESIQHMPKIDLLYNYRTLKGMEHGCQPGLSTDTF